MPGRFLFTEPLPSLKPLFWQGQPVFRQYAKLKNFLRQQLGETYAEIFAEPQVNSDSFTSGDGVWVSDILDNNAQRVSSGTPARITATITHKISVLTDFANAQSLSGDPENRRWGSLLAESLKLPGDHYIFFQDNKFVLTAWGFTSRNAEAEGAYILSTHYYLPGQKPERAVQQETAIETGISQHTADEIVKPDNQPGSPDEQEKAVTGSGTEPAGPDAQTAAPVVAAAAPLNATETGTPPIVPVVDRIPPKRKFNYWWLLLLLLIIPVVLMLKRCTGPSSSGALPDKPGMIIPIDSAKVIIDSGNIKYIVNDRLNVTLTGKNKDINQFAKRFKELYSSEDYQIIYYDTVVHHLQIQIPADKREVIRNELKNRMPEFEMLIWYESLLQRNKQPDDPAFKEVEKSWYQQQVKAEEAWDVTEGDSSVIIAILDDGFDLNHPEFRGKVVKPWNVPAGNNKVGTGNGSFHGTHVAGIALALSGNKTGGAGIAPNCRFMPVQVADRNGIMSSTAIINGVLYAIDNGADLINMSLGMQFSKEITGYTPEVQQAIIKTMYKDEEQFWEELFDIAYKKNIVIILAGGNQDIMIGMDPMERSAKTIKVSATDPGNRKAVFSNYGMYSTISAPGVRIYSSMPGNKYDYLDGTSMAAPIVTGGVALIKSVNPSLSFNQIVDLLQTTGIPVVNEPGKEMGNIIQLDRTLGIAKKKREQMPVTDCPDVQSKIDSLLQEIEKLRQYCNDGTTTTDTLKIPPGSTDPSFASGKWKSTTSIKNTTDGKKVTLYFEFSADGTGTLTLVESDNTTCGAPLKLTVTNGSVSIVQQSEAVCQPPPKRYQAYKFKCKPDANGCAECEAQNLQNSKNNLKFKLVKII